MLTTSTGLKTSRRLEPARKPIALSDACSAARFVAGYAASQKAPAQQVRFVQDRPFVATNLRKFGE